ncbi:dihydrofolate reductase family protein [Intrasporangium sp.]|uniref:dihydrofolate reductase family protein n=1 Tax=Intrasporangium sp. TaxID=1925024 RepID=UPI0033659CA9
MRLLVPGAGGRTPGEELDLEGLAAAYAVPADPWLRCNMVTTLDGAARGPDNRSGSINTDADHVVFELLRALSDAVIVGAGTIRVEGYSAIAVPTELQPIRERAGLGAALPLIAVSRTGFLPPTLKDSPHGDVLLATSASAPGIGDARSALGADHVLVCGEVEVDLAELLRHLHARGWTSLLTEGGPRLTASFLSAGLLDELCFTIAPRLVGGDHPRPVAADAAPLDLELAVLVEQDGSLMGRWLARR